MKPSKTREETLAELAARSSEGKAAAKRFESLTKRMIETPPKPRASAKKPSR